MSREFVQSELREHHFQMDISSPNQSFAGALLAGHVANRVALTGNRRARFKREAAFERRALESQLWSQYMDLHDTDEPIKLGEGSLGKAMLEIAAVERPGELLIDDADGVQEKPSRQQVMKLVQRRRRARESAMQSAPIYDAAVMDVRSRRVGDMLDPAESLEDHSEILEESGAVMRNHEDDENDEDEEGGLGRAGRYLSTEAERRRRFLRRHGFDGDIGDLRIRSKKNRFIVDEKENTVFAHPDALNRRMNQNIRKDKRIESLRIETLDTLKRVQEAHESAKTERGFIVDLSSGYATKRDTLTSHSADDDEEFVEDSELRNEKMFQELYAEKFVERFSQQIRHDRSKFVTDHSLNIPEDGSGSFSPFDKTTSSTKRRKASTEFHGHRRNLSKVGFGSGIDSHRLLFVSGEGASSSSGFIPNSPGNKNVHPTLRALSPRGVPVSQKQDTIAASSKKAAFRASSNKSNYLLHDAKRNINQEMDGETNKIPKRYISHGSRGFDSTLISKMSELTEPLSPYSNASNALSEQSISDYRFISPKHDFDEDFSSPFAPPKQQKIHFQQLHLGEGTDGMHADKISYDDSELFSETDHYRFPSRFFSSTGIMTGRLTETTHHDMKNKSNSIALTRVRRDRLAETMKFGTNLPSARPALGHGFRNNGHPLPMQLGQTFSGNTDVLNENEGEWDGFDVTRPLKISDRKESYYDFNDKSRIKRDQGQMFQNNNELESSLRFSETSSPSGNTPINLEHPAIVESFKGLEEAAINVMHVKKQSKKRAEIIREQASLADSRRYNSAILPVSVSKIYNDDSYIERIELMTKNSYEENQVAVDSQETVMDGVYPVEVKAIKNQVEEPDLSTVQGINPVGDKKRFISPIPAISQFASLIPYGPRPHTQPWSKQEVVETAQHRPSLQPLLSPPSPRLGKEAEKAEKGRFLCMQHSYRNKTERPSLSAKQFQASMLLQHSLQMAQQESSSWLYSGPPKEAIVLGKGNISKSKQFAPSFTTHGEQVAKLSESTNADHSSDSKELQKKKYFLNRIDGTRKSQLVFKALKESSHESSTANEQERKPKQEQEKQQIEHIASRQTMIAANNEGAKTLGEYLLENSSKMKIEQTVAKLFGGKTSQSDLDKSPPIDITNAALGFDGVLGLLEWAKASDRAQANRRMTLFRDQETRPMTGFGSKVVKKSQENVAYHSIDKETYSSNARPSTSPLDATSLLKSTVAADRRTYFNDLERKKKAFVNDCFESKVVRQADPLRYREDKSQSGRAQGMPKTSGSSKLKASRIQSLNDLIVGIELVAGQQI